MIFLIAVLAMIGWYIVEISDTLKHIYKEIKRFNDREDNRGL